MRVVAVPAPDGNGLRGMLEIILQPGWKTYWREPGDGGIPPSLTMGDKATPVSLEYPAPEMIEEGGLRFAGYHSGVALPFKADLAKGAQSVRFTTFVGICSTICVPFEASFDVPADDALSERVEQAFATLPASAAPGEGFSGASVVNGVLRLDNAAMPAMATIFLAPDAGLVLGPPKPSNGGVEAAILKDDGKAARLSYTLVNEGRAISGTLEIRR